MGEMQKVPARSGDKAVAGRSEQGLTEILDALLFLAILGFSAVALLAVALAAPLAIAISAVAGAASALTARTAKRGGWQSAGA